MGKSADEPVSTATLCGERELLESFIPSITSKNLLGEICVPKVISFAKLSLLFESDNEN